MTGWVFSDVFVGVASMIGHAHRESGRNNQDAFAVRHENGVIVVAVSDGCSAAPYAEAGAQLTARRAVNASLAWCAKNEGQTVATMADSVVGEVAASLGVVAREFGVGDGGDVLADVLLATLLVAVITPREQVVFGVGDGLLMLDDTVTSIESGARVGGPDYPAYRLVTEAGGNADAGVARLHHYAPAGRHRALAIGTDGALELTTSKPSLQSLASDSALRARPSLLQSRVESAVRAERSRFVDDVTVAMILRR